eukprot:1137216-Pelagomonas_calceolata.AAC.5
MEKRDQRTKKKDAYNSVVLCSVKECQRSIPSLLLVLVSFFRNYIFGLDPKPKAMQQNMTQSRTVHTGPKHSMVPGAPLSSDFSESSRFVWHHSPACNFAARPKVPEGVDRGWVWEGTLPVRSRGVFTCRSSEQPTSNAHFSSYQGDQGLIAPVGACGKPQNKY